VKIENKILKNFGIGINTNIKIHKILGLNNRKSPTSIKKKHTKKINLIYKKKILNRDLKKLIQEHLNFKSKIKIYKSVKNDKRKI
jgi:ribosomal protein S13